ncbi:MAG: DUF6338 family protein [bacterium]
MPTSVTALKIFILLMPGFVSIKISSIISKRLSLYYAKQSDFRYFIDSLLFSIAIAVLYLLIRSLFPNYLMPLDIPLKDTNLTFGGLSVISVSTLGLLAVAVGSVVGYAVKTYWVPNKFSMSKNVWGDVLYTYTNSWLRVYMEDGAVIEGWCRHYSGSAEKAELFLEEVQIFREQISDGEVFKEYRRSMLLTNPDAIQMIELLELKEN